MDDQTMLVIQIILFGMFCFFGGVLAAAAARRGWREAREEEALGADDGE